ncbi:hypothetical protein [Chitinophaga japonensis]|uniref:RNA polymerase sigma-70 factor (ECF subfamily) n=1 Tax=Chitinophaga japonensis TaxID=104662 RepID=A0A562T5G1_CHIJA|nr:hypothetical protein [Chitinophaga japonensis]TWI88306.1 hypothetical protein LX66_2391 [Chitinophaga japonensis]
MKRKVVPQNDKQLLRRLKAGDADALNDVYKQYRTWLLLVAATSMPDIGPAAAKAAVEQFFIDCWNHNLFNNVNVPLRTFLFASFAERCKKQRAAAPFVS